MTNKQKNNGLTINCIEKKEPNSLKFKMAKR